MKKLIIAMLILSVCMFAGCDSGGSSDTATTTPVTPGTPDTPPAATPWVVGDTVPEGAYFARLTIDSSVSPKTYTYSGVKYAGETIPALTAYAENAGVEIMDVFLYGDYIYAYGYNICDNVPVADGWGVSRAYAFWGINTTQFAGINVVDFSSGSFVAKRICESIKGENVTDMEYIFVESPLTSLEDGFVIPAGITNMNGAFAATSLGEVNLTIPSGVTNMNGAFEHSVYLKGTITVETTSTNVGTNYEGCFGNAGKDTAAGEKITLVCSDATLKANLIATNVDGSSHPLNKVE